MRHQPIPSVTQARRAEPARGASLLAIPVSEGSSDVVTGIVPTSGADMSRRPERVDAQETVREPVAVGRGGTRLTMARLRLYHEDYPLLLGHLRGLRSLLVTGSGASSETRPPHTARERGLRVSTAPIALVALFGSTARLTPHRDSDTDLCWLVDDEAAFFAEGLASPVPYTPLPPIAVLDLAYTPTPTVDGRLRLCRWGFSGVVADAQTPWFTQDEDFCAALVQDGVLLYQREGYVPPAPLRRLTTFAVWEDRVLAWLRAHPLATADRPARRNTRR